MYMMLSGQAPFKADTEEELFQSIKKGKFDFDNEKRDEISNDAKD